MLVYFIIIFLAILVVLWGITVLLIALGKLPGQSWSTNSLGLPRGSVRALLAFLILAFVFWVATKSQIDILKQVPEWLIGLLGTVVGFYFGSQAVSLAQEGRKLTAAISTASLVDGQVNQPYSQKLSAIGLTLPCKWSAPNLPSGLAIDADTGEISGTPTATTPTPPVPFTVVVTDNLGNSAKKDFTIKIA